MSRLSQPNSGWHLGPNCLGSVLGPMSLSVLDDSRISSGIAIPEWNPSHLESGQLYTHRLYKRLSISIIYYIEYRSIETSQSVLLDVLCSALLIYFVRFLLSSQHRVSRRLGAEWTKSRYRLTVTTP
jgi:hypothetical protein